MADHTLGTVRGTIKIDYDGAGILRAEREVSSFKKNSDKAANSVLKSFGKFGKGALTVAAGISAVTNAGGLLVGTLSILAPLAAAGFAAAPALIAGYASAMTVAKIATAGVGEALKAAGGDAKKFEESIKGLSPQAQGFAKAFRTSLPTLNAVKNSMQDAFFKGTASQVGGVVAQIAKLKPQASAVAGTMGQVATNLAKTATSGKNISNLQKILNGVNSFLKGIKTSLGPVVTGFLGLAAQGGAFGQVLGEKVGGALARLAAFLSRIDLGAIFAEAMPIIRSLGSFLGDVASIAKNLFGIFVGDGSNAAGVLSTLAGSLADFLNSAQGQAALTALGTAMAAISGSVGQVFLALLQAIAPAIVALAPGAAALAAQIAGVLVPAINTLAPALSAIAGFLSANIGWLGPMAGVILAVATAYKVYSAAATAVSAVQGALNSKLALSTIAWVRNAAASLASKAAAAASAAVMAGQVVAGFVASTAAMVANQAASTATSIAVGVRMVAAWIANTAVMVANRIALVAGVVAMYAVRAATIAWTAVQWALNIALNANPLGLIVIAIAALVAGIIIAYRNSETFRNIVQAVWAAIKVAISAVINWITGTVWPSLQRAWQMIAAGAKVLWSVIKTVWNGILATVRAVLAAVVGVVRNYINLVKAAFNGIKTVVTTIRNAFNQAKNAVSTAIGGILSLVRGLPGKVSGALGNLGSLLYAKGKTLVQGFINGIKSMIGAVAGAAKSVVGSVTKYLPGSPAETGPLSGRGYVLYRAQRFMDDFATGLKSGSSSLSSVAGKVVSQVAKSLPSDSRSGLPSRPNNPIYHKIPTQVKKILPGDVKIPKNNTGSSSSGGGSGSSGGTNTYDISIGSTPFATLVTNAITGAPVTVAKANKVGEQQLGWAGSGR